jgi:hypothetical protein
VAQRVLPTSPEEAIMPSGKATGKRETIAPRPRRKRYVRRDAEGQFMDDQATVGRSLSADRRRKAKATAKPGYGDRGDRKPSRRARSARRARS